MTYNSNLIEHFVLLDVEVAADPSEHVGASDTVACNRGHVRVRVGAVLVLCLRVPLIIIIRPLFIVFVCVSSIL